MGALGMGKKDYKKLQFDFSEDAIERLDKLKYTTDAVSRTEVIRNSLRVYEYIVAMTKEGYGLEFRKNKKKIKVIPLPV